MGWNLASKVKLNNGIEMPRLGLGVYQAEPGETTRQAVLWALEAGYRHIDTAAVYANETDVGEAIRESGVPREQIFVTTKLWTRDHGAVRALRGFTDSLDKLDIRYIDLYLSHFPVSGLRGETWKSLERLLEEGRVHAIGVSNYTVKHLEELLRTAKVVPAVNQVEFSPFLFQKGLLEFCRKEGIQLEAYAPLTQGAKFLNPVVRGIAQTHGKTPAQVLLRWGLQHDVVVIPKSVNQDRIVANANVFDFALADEEMERLDNLNEGFRTCWDPSHIA